MRDDANTLPTQPLGDDDGDTRPNAPLEDEGALPTLPLADEGAQPTLPNQSVRDSDDIFNLPHVDTLQPTYQARLDEHQQATMPVFREPNAPDPRATLVGSGGLDPNPDMAHGARTVANQPVVPANTVPMYAQPQQPVNAYGSYAPPPPQNGGSRPLPVRKPRAPRPFGLPMGCFYGLIGLLVTLCGGVAMLIFTVFAVFVPYLEERWGGDIARVEAYQAFESTFIYDRYGDRLFEVFNEGRRTTVTYDRFPRHLINATVAIEDGTFWDNWGVDFAATAVAFLRFVGASSDENTPGGSTITQQLVRNVLFDPQKRAERSVARKAEEIMLALLLTQRRSKEDILALYLNEIYYGNLAYGAQTAAQTFFGKNVQDLTLGEAALLAGLPQAPANLDPLNPDPNVQSAVYARQRQVLDEMVKDGYITPDERDQALREGLSFNPPDAPLKAPHFTVYAQREFERLMQQLGYAPQDIAAGGFKVYTTVDQNVNEMARQAAAAQVAQLANNRVSNAAVFIMKPLTGEIMGMVGSIDYNSRTIDGRVNVTTAFRQPGSTVKAFTYAAALERGMSPADVIWDTKTDIGIPGQPTYSPVNYDRRFHGPMTMRSALANSYNIPAVQTLRLVGVDYLLQFMRRFGVETLGTDASRYGLSLTLGGGEITLLELTAGYAVFANQGSYVRPTSILCVIDRNGDIVYRYENGCPTGRMTPRTVDRLGLGRQALDPRIAWLITDILADNAARTPAMGANSPLRTPNIETAVKTGTTNDFKDNWTVGYTRNVAIGVWVGNNDGTPMQNVSGLMGAAPIWNAVMTNIYNNPAYLNAFAVGGQLLENKAAPPPGLAQRQICDVRRLTDPATDCPRVTEWFLEGAIGVPDAQGNLIYSEPPRTPAINTRTLQEVSVGVYRAQVVALPPDVANAIQFPINPAQGDKIPPPPRYCRVPESAPADLPGVQTLLFVAGPTTSQGDAVEAERYAQSNNIAYLPTIECWADVFVALQNAANPNNFGEQTGALLFITSPTAGQVVSGDVQVFGTALFDPNLSGQYFHLFLRGGPYADWTAAGNPIYNSVENGYLETLLIGGFPSGEYQLRLAVLVDNTLVAPPFDVTFYKQ